ncbi:MAG TPA: histidine phosphatase family protein [Euzebya sp.]|nr:histidine phosphatase family protein [Euzebya sp.]
MNEPRSYAQHRYVRPAGQTEILLVRHGQSAALVDGEPFPMIDGQGDPPLTPLGLQQAEKVGERLSREPVDAIYVTSMRRTHQTAAPLAARLRMTPVVEGDLREVHLGEWEGGVLRRMAAEGHPLYQRMHQEQRWDVIPGAEPGERFAQRTVVALERIAARHPDQVVVVVAHGGVIGQLAAQACGSTAFRFGGADHGSITHLVVGPQGWTLRRFNDSAHIYDTVVNHVDLPT